MGQQFTITLPDDLADMIRAKVASGEYASVDEVIGEALAQIDETPVHSGDDFDRWLHMEVVERCLRFERNPSAYKTSDDVEASVEDEYRRILAERQPLFPHRRS